jgi:hypothetical protein
MGGTVSFGWCGVCSGLGEGGKVYVGGHVIGVFRLVISFVVSARFLGISPFGFGLLGRLLTELR